ncbi:VOC family protein [Hymenobacter jejuensis]|uniref:VOC domain-containing protein n=1 Tax=Hymenobacter jejuensis TaxID=2502781 RepID=A0A5B7ZVV4_9BACT|nr:VOC family protein [Hymenobacter jejuensis]QDA58939.1 hypothetical protein FHG12_01950 [Hymenobacter jejuensis]
MKQLFVLLLLCSFFRVQPAHSQAKASSTPTFNHAAVCVKDLKKSVAFYHNVMYLEEIANPFNDGIHAWLKIGPNLQLHVIQRDCAPITNKNIHLCFAVASLSDFIGHLEKTNVAYTNLKGEGKEPTLRADGVKQIYLQDPDGYWIEVNDAK